MGGRGGGMGIQQDFVKFLERGNLVQLAVAFVMGAAFSALVNGVGREFFSPFMGVAV